MKSSIHASVELSDMTFLRVADKTSPNAWQARCGMYFNVEQRQDMNSSKEGRMDALSAASKIGGDECGEGVHFLECEKVREIETMLLQREQT